MSTFHKLDQAGTETEEHLSRDEHPTIQAVGSASPEVVLGLLVHQKLTHSDDLISSMQPCLGLEVAHLPQHLPRQSLAALLVYAN